MKKEIRQKIIYRARSYCTTEQTKTAWQTQNYTSIHKIRQTGQKKGSIALFVLNNFNYNIITKSNVCNDDIEYLTVEKGNYKEKGHECFYFYPEIISDYIYNINSSTILKIQ